MIALGHIGTGNWGITVMNMMSKFATIKRCYGHQNRDLMPKGVKISEINDIINDRSLDGIVIASPPETHYKLAKRCLKSGHNIFVEKPMSLTVKEGQELVDLARVNNLIIMVGFIYLYSDEYISKIKKIRNVNNIKSYFMQTEFRHLVPCLINLGSHFVALILDFYNENPIDVKVGGDDDDAFIVMDFGSKNGDVYASRKSKSKKREVIFMENEKILYNWDILKINHEVDNPLLNECRHFVECLKNNSEPNTNGLMGLKIMKLVSGELP